MAYHGRSLQQQMARSRAALNRMHRTRWTHFVPEPTGQNDRAPRTNHRLLILQTYVVQPLRGISAGEYYEIWCAPDDGPDVQVLKVLTRNPVLYHRALAGEGRDVRFDLTYHTSKRPDGSLCRVLDSLERI